MALSRINAWVAGQVLTASALVGEFDNIYNNGLSLISPLTGALDFNGNRIDNLAKGTLGTPGLNFSADTNTGLHSSAADVMEAVLGGVRGVQFTGVGTTAVNWLDLRNSIAGSPLTIAAEGTDSNIGIQIVPVGTGFVWIATAGGIVGGPSVVPGLALGDARAGLVQVSSGTISLVANLQEVARAQAANSATNYLLFSSAAAGATPYLGVGGGDANINLELRAKGSGAITTATAFVATTFLGTGQMTPDALFSQSYAKAWISMTNAVTIEDSFNIASLTDESAAGYFTVNFHRAFANANYLPLGVSQVFTSTGHVVGMGASKNRQPGSCTLMTFRTDTFGGSPDASAFIVFFGRQ